jgi:hypothetical protein
VFVWVFTHRPLQSVCPVGQRHVPIWQVCPPVHALPHRPQWVLFVFRSKHCIGPPQYVCPIVGHTHIPPRHICAEGQRAPHPLQLLGSSPVLTSQPLAGLRSQSAKPAMHDTITHMPLTHAVEARARVHARLHAPQCAMLVERLVSQPLAGFVSQSPKLGLQRVEHIPFVHTAAPLLALHARPHIPQLVVLVLSVVSHDWLPSQSAVGAGQGPAKPQRPITHTAMRPVCSIHAPPQRLQCATDVLRSTSQPSAGSPLQSAKPASHIPIVHIPPAHAAVACGSMQRLPHAPQWRVSLRRLTSQPSATFMLQLSKPVTQAASWQAPAWHAVTALGMRRAQRRSHWPQ